MKDIGIRVKSSRNKKDWSQEELASQSGVSRSIIAKIENGSTKVPRQNNLESLSKALDVDPIWLQMGEKGTDQLDKESLSTALMIQALPEAKRAAILATIRAMST